MRARKTIDKLNTLLRQELGDSPLSGKFQWRRAEDVFYLVKTRSFKTAAGIHVPKGMDKYTRVHWADRIGNVWMLVQWEAPQMSETEWVNTFGVAMPYPAKGTFVPTNVVLGFGVKPDDAITRIIIGSVKEQLNDDLNDHLALVQAQAEAAEAVNVLNLRDKFSDQIDRAEREPDGLIYSLPSAPTEVPTEVGVS